MFSKLKNDLKDAITYPFLDWKIILITGTIMLTLCILSKLSYSKLSLYGYFISLNINLFNLNVRIIPLLIGAPLIFLQMGYGSRIVYKGMKGENRPPKYKRPLKLVWEGFKKYCIYIIYVSVMVVFYMKGKTYYSANDMPMTILCFILFYFIYIVLIGALLNRYENKGKFIKAFYYREIYNLLKAIGVKDILTILICAIIGQSFVISCFIDFNLEAFSLMEILIFILTFFLSPISLISTKRLVSLNLRRVYDKERIR